MEPSSSNFLKGARAMDDFALQQRVRGAVLFVGAPMLVGAVEPGRNFAVSAFINPMAVDQTMLALVSCTPEVALAVVVPDDGSSVDTTAVTDGEILAAVEANWAIVSAKYTQDPLAGPAAV